MKTLGRILMILAVFTMIMGITYGMVNAGSSATSTNVSAFDRGDMLHSSPNGERPEFDRGDARGAGWMFGMIKNVGMIAVIVALIVIPKNIRQKRIKQVSASAG